MRLIPASSAACAKLRNDRATPGSESDVSVKRKRSPKIAVSTGDAGPLNVLSPYVYVGKGGVTGSGAHVASGGVKGLPSAPACWMAVIGRQNWSVYFVSQQQIPASARATLSR